MMTGAQRAEGSARARALLVAQTCWREARSVLFYAPMPAELDVWPLVQAALDAGKVVGLPRFAPALEEYVACGISDPKADIGPGHFGIFEPKAHCAGNELSRVDLILVPGLAFDLDGRRLGRGKGFYDQLLAGLPGFTCGVTFDEQVVEEVPVESHDIQLDCVLTPTRWVEIGAPPNRVS
jgi:5-formyltetrahydrofolate cyclo-ligase